MPLTDLISDFFSSFSITEVHAEAPPAEDKEEGGDSEGGEEEDAGEKEESGEEGESSEEGGEDGGEEEGGDDGEEEEEEDEDEPVDPKPALEAECAKSPQCAPLKHHYDDCAERVMKQDDNPDHKGPKEDCVEEFFHLTHCATQCAAGKLFKQLR